jgi:diguanylate cyclase (GGDEF)-like protein/PAS domain S-box-containing protein
MTAFFGRRVGPFGLFSAVAVVALLLPPYPQGSGHLLVTAAVLAVALALAFRAPADSGWQIAPPLLVLVAIAVLRDASGAADSGLGPLVALPIFWVALFRNRIELFLVALGTFLVFTVPLVVVGSPDYPASDWRRALLWTLIAALVGPVVQSVVRSLHAGEDAQTKLAAELDSVLDAATEHAIISTTVDGTISTFNRGAERMLGYAADDVVGKETPLLIHDPAEITLFAAAHGHVPGYGSLVAAARSQEHETREWTYLAKDGTRIPVRLVVSASRAPDGQLLGFTWVGTDITAEQTALHEVQVMEQRWRALLDHLPDRAVLTVDNDMRYGVALGSGLLKQGGKGLQHQTLYETSSPENVARLEPLYRAALAGNEGSIEILTTHTGRMSEVVAVPLPFLDGNLEALVVARDITDVRQREEQLADVIDRFASLFDEAPFGIIVCDLEGITQSINEAACLMVGRSKAEMMGVPAALVGGDPDRHERFVESIRRSPGGRVSSQSQVVHKDGHLIDIAFEAILLRQGDTPREILINAVDISERRRFEEQLTHLAQHDPLTGLANRRRFDEELERHLGLCERYSPRGAVIMLDLDGLKHVNDTLGHQAGDELIVSVADILIGRMRKSDVVARLGGDEFAILLADANRIAAELVAADIVHLVRERVAFVDGTRPQELTASVGVVLVERTDLTPSDLLTVADLTMYDAKNAGRNQYALRSTGRDPSPDPALS